MEKLWLSGLWVAELTRFEVSLFTDVFPEPKMQILHRASS